MTRKKKLAGDGNHNLHYHHHRHQYHHYPAATITSLKVWLITLLLSLLVEVVTTSSGTSSEMGSCWRLKRKDGTCGHMQRNLVSREECCSGVQRRGWSSGSYNTHNNSFSLPQSSSSSNSVISEQPICFPCSMLCEGVKCGEDRKCVVRCGAPRCVCSPQCHLKNKEPVCGSDGRTYASECHLLKRACRKKKRVLVAHYGPCQTCSGVKCRGGKQCVLDEKMTPMCIRCPSVCSTPDKRALCASDGRTYRSRCQLRQASCRAGYLIHRAYMGQCLHASTCETVRCWGNQTCLTNVETQQPQCTECNDHLDTCRPSSRPVCASDGRMYPSWCAFRHEACRSGRALTPALHQHCASNHTKADECKPTKPKKAKKLKNHLQELEEQHQKEDMLQHRALSSQLLIVERLTAQQEEIDRIRESLPEVIPNSIDGVGSGQLMPEEAVLSSTSSSTSNRDKKKKHRRKKKKCKKSRKRRRKDRKVKSERESN